MLMHAVAEDLSITNGPPHFYLSSRMAIAEGTTSPFTEARQFAWLTLVLDVQFSRHAGHIEILLSYFSLVLLGPLVFASHLPSVELSRRWLAWHTHVLQI
jgi:hypothetical protein